VESYCEQVKFDEKISGADSAPATADGVGAALPTAVSDMSRTKPPITGAIDEGLVKPVLIAQRLRATLPSELSGDPPLSQRGGGILTGVRWATDTATLDELKQIAALESREWTSVRLDSGHSLISQLIAERAIPPSGDSAIDLSRDSFIEGIVTGASRVLQTAAPYLSDDAQLANVDLQNMLEKQQQTLQMLSNISKMLQDTALSVIRKVGG